MGEQTIPDRSRRPFDPLLAVYDDRHDERHVEPVGAGGTAGRTAAVLLLVAALAMVLAVGGGRAATPQSALAASPASMAAIAPAEAPEPTSTEPLTTAAIGEPATTAAVAAPAAAAGCSVLFVGDSVGTGMLHNGLQGALTDAGCKLVWSGGAPGIEVSAGAAALARVKSKSADVVVVVLGYHNARTNTRSGQFPGLIDQVMKAAAGRLVVWPMLGRTPDCSPWYSGAVVTADQALHAATGRWPNLALLDYPSVIGAHPEYGQDRCPHLTSAGYRAVALWLARQVRSTVDSSR